MKYKHNQKHREYHNEIQKAFRAKRLAAGLCVRCGIKPHKPTAQTCGCDVAYAKIRKQSRFKLGRCYDCNAKLSSALIKNKRAFCDACRIGARKRKARKRKQRLQDGLCGQCGKAPRVKAADATRKRKNNQDLKFCARCINLFKLNTAKVKSEVLNAYGDVCACCKESEPIFLTIDHIDGGGTEHRKKVNVYDWLRTNNYPSGFQILCYNCNCGRAINSGICPHKSKI